MQFANHTVTGPKSIANLHRSGSNLNDPSPLATFRAYDKLPNDEHVRKARGLPFFTIYKGDWTQPRDSDDTTARPVKAVCKMADSPQLMERLREEARLYEKSLKELQGNVVPNFYGCYEGAIQVEERGVTPIVCIILSDCGEVVDVEELIKSDILVNKVMQSLIDLHVIGKIYPQWTSYNFCTAILIQDDDVRLVGFSGCITGHVCNIDRTQFTQYALDFQSLDHFGCDDLYATAVELGWLTPGFIKGPLDVRVDVFPSTEAMLRELRKIYRSLDKAHFIKEGETLLDAVETYRKEYGHRKEVVGRLVGAMYSWPPQENHTGWKDWDFSEEIAVSPELIGIDPDDEDETHLDSDFDKDIHKGLSMQ